MVGHVEVPLTSLLGFLQLDGGIIHAAEFDLQKRTLLLRIEHEDMPPNREVDGIEIHPVMLSYRTTVCGHNCDLGSHEVIMREPIVHHGISLLG